MSNKRKKLWKGLVLFTAVLVVLAGGAGMLFGEELKITSSIRRLSGADRVYYMEADTDYHFEEFLEAGGADSDKGSQRVFDKMHFEGILSDGGHKRRTGVQCDFCARRCGQPCVGAEF